jgi:hypothetical protein
MKLAKIKLLILIVFFFFKSHLILAEEKILSVPLINLENLEPSYEEIDSENDNNINSNIKIKEKNIKKNNIKDLTVNLIGLDKITAKTSQIEIKIGETKKFGLLEIKAVKCGKSDSINELGEAAYIQVKDISDNTNEKIFVFNGWTFSSSPSLKPMDHPVYDLWLVGCNNV